ncbi:MAG: hypothetical protein RR037_03775 [Alistipes sp.]
MEEKKMNAEESIELISKMINNTRSRMERHAGTPFIVMGYTTAAVSLAVWYGFTITPTFSWHYLWLIISLVALISWLCGRKKRQNKEVSTYVDRIVGYIWISIGIVAFVHSMLAFFITIPILYIIVVLMGLGTALTGWVTRFSPCTLVGLFSAIVLAPLFLFVQGIDTCLIFAAVFIVMMVVPGHILNYKNRHSNGK